MHIDSEGRPTFAPEKTSLLALRIDTRRVPIPPNRLTPLKSSCRPFSSPQDHTTPQVTDYAKGRKSIRR